MLLTFRTSSTSNSARNAFSNAIQILENNSIILKITNTYTVKLLPRAPRAREQVSHSCSIIAGIDVSVADFDQSVSDIYHAAEFGTASWSNFHDLQRFVRPNPYFLKLNSRVVVVSFWGSGGHVHCSRYSLRRICRALSNCRRNLHTRLLILRWS